MANNLTGDYDVVAQLPLGAVDRILAALHSVNRLPHSLSMGVHDLADRKLGAVAVGVVDIRGLAVADSAAIRATVAQPSRQIFSKVEGGGVNDFVVNRRVPHKGSPPPAGKHSNLSGVAQLQLGAPSMRIPPNQTDRAEIHIPARIRYSADANTPPLSPFLRGDIVITFGVKSNTTPQGASIGVDLDGPAGNVQFNPIWSETPLSAADRNSIDIALMNVIHESFAPSTSPVGSGLRAMNFTAVNNVVAALINVDSVNTPSPASVQHVFLGAADQFAIAISDGFVSRKIAGVVNDAIAPHRYQSSDTQIDFDYLVGTYTFHIYTNISVGNASVQLFDGVALPFGGGLQFGFPPRIALTIPIRVNFGWKDKPFLVPDPQDFNFTITQNFGLNVQDSSLSLYRMGNLAVDIPNGVPDLEADQARSRATQVFDQLWTSNESTIQQKLNQALADTGFAPFLNDLISPPGGSGMSMALAMQLAYTSVEIKAAGIVLHGSLSLPPWPMAHVEFDNDAAASSTHPEYRALSSWIPGGTVHQFDWSFGNDGSVSLSDGDRFVTTNAPTGLGTPQCLAISGYRISASGPPVPEAVLRRKCSLLGLIGVQVPQFVNPRSILPSIAIVRPKPGGAPGLEILGHTSPWLPRELAGASTNLLVHFASDGSAQNPQMLTRALGKATRPDAATALLSVLTPAQRSLARTAPGVLFTDDHIRWEEWLGVRTRPTTVLLHPSGKEAWRHEGDIEAGALGDALRGKLTSAKQLYPQFAESPLEIGQRPPNFVLEFHGEPIHLRKLAGRPAMLVFFRNSSAASVETIHNLQRAMSHGGVESTILAIADGESEARCPAGVIFVPDAERKISQAYGVTVWPTTVLLDAAGLVRDVRFGLIPASELDLRVKSKTPILKEEC